MVARRAAAARKSLAMVVLYGTGSRRREEADDEGKGQLCVKMNDDGVGGYLLKVVEVKIPISLFHG